METCYKVFRTELINRHSPRSNRFGFEPEVTVKIAKLGWRLFEVPIWSSGRDYAEGKKIGARDAVSAVWTLLKYWWLSDIGDVGKHTLARMSELGAYNKTMFDTFSDHLGQRVLEVGSGAGNLSRFILDRELAVLSDARRGLPPPASAPVRHIRERRDQMSPSYDIQGEGFAEPSCRLGYLLERARAHRGRPSRARGALFVASTRRMPGGVSPRACDVVPTWTGISDISVATLRPSSLKSSNRPASAWRSASYFNWVGAIGWYFFGRILRRRHITKVATRGYNFVLGTAKSGAGHSVWFRPFDHCDWSATCSIHGVSIENLPEAPRRGLISTGKIRACPHQLSAAG